jgi:hypothetical protein
MDQRRPKNISLPSMANLLDSVSLKSSGLEAPAPWYDSPPRTAPIPYSLSTVRRPESRRAQREEPTTPKAPQGPAAYPSPESEGVEERAARGDSARKIAPKLDDIAGTPRKKTTFEGLQSPMIIEFPVEIRSSEIPPSAPKATAPTSPLTPSIVHYRPNGVLNAKSRRSSLSGPPTIGKKSNGKVNDLQIRLVKWDRVSDKGTAPLNLPPRPPRVPKSCVLCHLIKRKVYKFEIQLTLVHSYRWP